MGPKKLGCKFEEAAFAVAVLLLTKSLPIHGDKLGQENR
jgi:hypothetical protein